MNDSENIVFEDLVNINNIVDGLKEVNNLNSKIYNDGMVCDYKFNFNEPVTNEMIAELESKISGKLPQDFKEFLLISNGMFFKYGEAQICSIDSILETYSIFSFPKNIVAVASIGGHCYIGININDAENKCIYAVGEEDEFFKCLNCSFTEFLNRFVVSYGSDFWSWGATNSNIPKIDNNNLSIINQSASQTLEFQIRRKNK